MKEQNSTEGYLIGITPEYPTHPTVLGLGFGLRLGLGIGVRDRIRD